VTAPALFYLTLASALGASLIAGVVFAFSSFIMPALTKLPPSQGIAAMQSINVAVLNRSFLGVFVGTAGLCLVLVVTSLLAASTNGSKLRLAGAVLYVFGTFFVTLARNVPLNNALAKASPHAAQAAQTWSNFATPWIRWNTGRALAALMAAAALILSLGQD
jgi:uncharacterized membrane protein